MENIILSIILFMVYLCTISCLIYSPENSRISQPQKTKVQSLPIEKAFAEMLKELENSDTHRETVEYTLEKMSQEDRKSVQSAIQKETEIDLNSLPLRQARKVAKALKIHQKVNGKDAPVKRLRAQIIQRIQEEPSVLSKIYEILEIDVQVSA